MARQWRIEYPGAYYHILSRGNDRQEIFYSDDDRKLFIDLIGKFSDRFQIDIFAYVLMGNHYHLLIKTHQENLSKGMQWLGTTYTRKINIKYGKSGHLFQGRYKGVLVENDQYMLRLSCYIHRNPLRAGIVKRLSDYPWSSYRAYGYGRETFGWLKTGLILDLMSQKSDPRREYRSKVQSYSDEQASIWEDVQHGLIYGSQDFVTEIRSRFLSDSKDPELPQYNQIAKAFSPQEIMQRAGESLNFDWEAAAARKRNRIASGEKDKRDLLLYLLWESGGLTNQEIGSYFGLTYSSVSKRVTKTGERLKREKELMDAFELLKSQIKV